MISDLGYKVIHLAAIFLVLLSLGAACVDFAGSSDSVRRRSGWWAILNGVGLFVVIVAGFGLVARLGIAWPWPGWLVLKLGIWLGFGVLFMLVKRVPAQWRLWTIVSWILASAAAYLAVYKP
ncbi:MAG: hypothetical protein Kow00109_19610 [Acidobacteriota bacterium]